MKEIKRIAIIEDGQPPFPSRSRPYYDGRSTEGIKSTAAAEQIPGGMTKLEDNIDRDELSAVRGPGVSAFVLGQAMANGSTKQSPLSIALDGIPASARKVMVAIRRAAVIARKKAEGGHIEQERGFFSELREISGGDCISKLSELTSKNELTKLLSASTNFVGRIIEGVSWVFSKNVVVLVLLLSNPPMVSAVDTYNSTVVVSPPSLQPLNMAHQLAPPPPPPMHWTRRGFLPLGPPSLSEMKKRLKLTESKTEWGLSPKPSPPSCLPGC